MAILCLAAEVSRQPRGLAGMLKSMARKLLPREPGAPRVAEDEGLMGLEEAPEGTCKTQNTLLYILLGFPASLIQVFASSFHSRNLKWLDIWT